MDVFDQLDETLLRVRGWVTSEPGLSIDDEGTIVMEGSPALRLTARSDPAGISLTQVHVERQSSPERVDAIVGALAPLNGPIATDVRFEGGDLTTTLSARIDAAVLSKHAFLGAVHNLAAGVDAARITGEGHHTESVNEQTRVLERVWMPTHVVPPGGLPAWPTPDGRSPASTTLEHRVELSIAERKGDWARVVGVNGWTGWVDGRRLVAVGKASSVQPGEAGIRPTVRVRVLPLIGLAFVGISAVLPWIRTSEGNLNALEVPLAFLWDRGAADPPALAWALIGVALLAALVVGTGRAQLMYIPIGLVGMAIPLFFAGQVFRSLMAVGDPASDLLRVLGFGVPVAFVAGVLLLSSTRR